MKLDSLDSIKELRNMTGLGLGDCKKALEECKGDIKKAIDKLRVIGIANFDKKINRPTLDGLIAMNVYGNRGVLIELNCETDFVARSEKFRELILNLTSIAYQVGCTSINELKNAKYNGVGTVHEAIVNSASIFGERLDLSSLCYLEAQNGIVAGYVHGDVRNLGRIGALVELQSYCDKSRLQEIGRQIAMHVVAMKPEALSISHLDQAKLKNERFLVEEQVKNLNKPQKVKEKIVDGRMAKYYEEVVLLEQKFIMNDKIKISDFIRSSELSVNSTVELTNYKLLILGNRS